MYSMGMEQASNTQSLALTSLPCQLFFLEAVGPVAVAVAVAVVVAAAGGAAAGVAADVAVDVAAGAVTMIPLKIIRVT